METGSINASRLLEAIGRIGYDPPSALMDIIDNAVSENATEIKVHINLAQQAGKKTGPNKTIIDSFHILDNGNGMDRDKLVNALTLGSSNRYYQPDTLSKFGLGLKSASSSLGRRLEIITTADNQKGEIFTAILDQDLIESEYVYELRNSSKEEAEFLQNAIGKSKSGTAIIIGKIRQQSMPRTAEIIKEIKSKCGVTYYYYMSEEENDPEKKLTLTINNDIVEAVDPLFCSDISSEGNLDDRSWDGLSPKWIQRPQDIQLDEQSGKIKASVEITQLPHPPSFKDSEIMTQKDCRNKYNIAAGNYGFYIYRNKRLISWAATLGMVPRDQDLYSFRGRLLINSDSDDVLNINVSKNNIHLSSIAWDQLYPIVSEAQKKSRAAWQNAGRLLKEKFSESPHDTINEELDGIGQLEQEDEKLEEEAAPSEKRKELQERRKEAEQSSPATKEEKEELKERGQRVHYVDSLDNNQIWQRAHDAENGLIVRVNRSHRLFREILNLNTNNTTLLKTIDLILFGLAMGEHRLIYKSNLDTKDIETTMTEFRERVGESLSEIIRQIDLSKINDVA